MSGRSGKIIKGMQRCHVMKIKWNKMMITKRQKVIQTHPYIFISFNNLYRIMHVLWSNAQYVKQLIHINESVEMGLNNFVFFMR